MCIRDSYDALQVSLEKRFSGGLYSLVSYTWSRCFDNGSSEGAPVDLQLLAENYAVCSYDMTNNLTWSSMYDLPFGKGQRFLSHSGSFLNALIGNWQLAGILTDHTGLPYTPVLSSDVANIGVSGQWPNRVGNPGVSHPSAKQWFNPAAFAAPAPYTFGDSRRNVLRADGLVPVSYTHLCIGRKHLCGER